MSTRQETAQKKAALMDDLRRIQSEGRVRPGEMAVSQRELAQRYGLSNGLVAQTLQKLVGEGVLYSVPRVGTFVGQPRNDAFEFYLLVLAREIGEFDGPRDFYITLQMGFDERIAQLGGTSLTMTQQQAVSARKRGELPPLAGVFNVGQHSSQGGWGAANGVPQVCFENMVEDEQHSDVVGFDNEAGGRLATGHLLKNGHRRIAFLALHDATTAEQLIWSARREDGWRATLCEAGIEADQLVLRPNQEQAQFAVASHLHHRIVAQQVAAAHIGPRGLEVGGESVSAVVTYNDAAAVSVLAALRAAKVPHEFWPALVGFDNAPSANGHILSSLRLPWEEVGRIAAELLWARKHGELVGPPTYRAISMRLIPRLTCHTTWSHQPAHAALAVSA